MLPSMIDGGICGGRRRLKMDAFMTGSKDVRISLSGLEINPGQFGHGSHFILRTSATARSRTRLPRRNPSFDAPFSPRREVFSRLIRHLPFQHAARGCFHLQHRVSKQATASSKSCHCQEVAGRQLSQLHDRLRQQGCLAEPTNAVDCHHHGS